MINGLYLQIRILYNKHIQNHINKRYAYYIYMSTPYYII